MQSSIFSIILVITFVTSFFSQSSFILNEESGPNIDIISDITSIDNKYYCLFIHLSPAGSDNTFSTLNVYDISGKKLSENKIGGLGYFARQFLQTSNESLQILGSIQSDSCSSAIVISEFFYELDSIIEQGKYDFCNQQFIQKAIQIVGLNNDKFIEGYYVQSGPAFYKFILQQSESNQLTKVFDSLPPTSHLSVDFSGSGYIIRDNNLCDFYTSDFIYRKQKFNILEGFEPSTHATRTPYGNHLLLEHLKKPSGDPPNGQVVRLVDSTLAIRKITTVIPPFHANSGAMDLPFNGGLKKTEDNNYWVAGTYGFSPQWDTNYYSITKLDAELNIICNHFLGFDAIYRLFGTTVTPDGGILVYGWRLPRGGVVNSGDEDAFAINLGPNCELPTVSTNGPNHPMISISAFPNPGINELSFTIQGFDPASLRMELIDISGKILFTAHDLSNRVEVADMPAGQYFYRILQEDRLLGVGAWVKL